MLINPLILGFQDLDICAEGFRWHIRAIVSFFNPCLSRDLDKVYFFEAGTCPGDGSRVFE